MELKNGLPERCFAKHPVTGETIIISRYESGYCPIIAQSDPDVLNAELGVTKAQAAAMLVGSMFGWNVPGANPANYDANGRFK